MSGRLASVLAGAMMLLLPAQALAQPGCRTIRALTNADRRQFDDLTFNLGSASVTLRAGSRAPDLEGPSECEMSTEGDHRAIECRWRFYGEEPAIDFYQNLASRMSACLPATMTEPEIRTRTEGWRVMRRHEALLSADYSETKVQLSLVDATRRSDRGGPPSGNHYVQITVELEQGE